MPLCGCCVWVMWVVQGLVDLGYCWLLVVSGWAVGGVCVPLLLLLRWVLRLLLVRRLRLRWPLRYGVETVEERLGVFQGF